MARVEDADLGVPVVLGHAQHLVRRELDVVVAVHHQRGDADLAGAVEDVEGAHRGVQGHDDLAGRGRGGADVLLDLRAGVAGGEGALDVGGDEQPERHPGGRRHQQRPVSAVRHPADGVHQHQPFHARGVGEGEGLGRHAAHRVTDGDEAVDAEMVEEGDDVVREGLDGVCPAAAALAVSAQVEADHPAVGGEVRHLVVPAVPVGGPPVEEHQGRAAGVARALVVVGQVRAVDSERGHGASPPGIPAVTDR